MQSSLSLARGNGTSPASTIVVLAQGSKPNSHHAPGVAGPTCCAPHGGLDAGRVQWCHCQLNAAPRQAQCRRWRHHPGDSGTGLAPPTNRDCSSCLHHAVRPSACSFHQKSPVTVTGGVLCLVFRVLCFLSCASVTVQLSRTLGAAKPENVLRSGDPAGTKQWPQ